jgi:uncharacterized protein YjiS (DUF1127 family)
MEIPMTDMTVARPAPDPVLAGLLDRHGTRAMLAALLRTILRHRRDQLRTRRAIRDLSPHLRRDIGLAEPDPGKVQGPGLFL